MQPPGSPQIDLERLVAKHLPHVPLNPLPQKVIPRIAKHPGDLRAVEKAIKGISTHHIVYLGDARNMSHIPSESVHLVMTSPPYWTLKKYPEREGQLGCISDYDRFLKELDAVWAECYRVLVKGGRLVIVVGDVCLSRRKHGEHMVVPLHASIQEHCWQIGFQNLAPIIWYKIANAAFEVDNGTSFLGKPYEPNAIIKHDIEYILMQRKPGGYRRPSDAMRVLSVIGEKNHRQWFNQILHLRGASTRDHPAPYPPGLAERMVRMFSFVGDTVLDPFSGTGTTSIAAARWGRNSIAFEIENTYHRIAIRHLTEVVREENLPAKVTKVNLPPRS